MTYVMPDGFLRLYRRKNGFSALLARVLVRSRRRREALSQHQMRDLGLLDGRRTPGPDREDHRRDVWSGVGWPPRYL
ncbi:hypothetical protein NBH20_20755 [Rhizobium sp. S153]|uniref:DUF1127 domain-containing protein n=1 Tax=Ciceribacter sichuanensis TaxID=2949647 RepID=A0ABT0VCK3_9HYPH|nr:hypothetical protein [Ciceribacter sp. S153]MCM2403611.1 hypothetical protein [Ciceribacter sp. S153]